MQHFADRFAIRHQNQAVAGQVVSHWGEGAPTYLTRDCIRSQPHPLEFHCACDPDSSGACQMDGAAGATCIGTCMTHPQFRYVDNSSGLVNPYLSLATQYGWANYMFQSNQGASFAAHQFIFSGTSALSAADDAAGIFAQAIIPGPGNQAGKVAGCIAPAGALSSLIGPPGTKTQRIYPCFEHLTMPDLLPANFSWRYYTPSASSIWTAPNAIQHICQSSGPGGVCTGPEWTTNLDLKPSDVLQDIANCNLRSVSWVIPDGRNSDHAKGSGPGGPSWVASIVNAIGGSSTCDANTGYWHNTTIFITWDDWGGWYDHEAPSILPGPQGDYQLGLRVPLIAVSAYTPAGFIDNERHDFGSILRFIEQNFGIAEGGLNFADARAATNLTTFFDLAATPRLFATIAAPRSASFFLHDKRPPTDPDDD
jgi:phospholipase C